MGYASKHLLSALRSSLLKRMRQNPTDIPASCASECLCSGRHDRLGRTEERLQGSIFPLSESGEEHLGISEFGGGQFRGCGFTCVETECQV